MSRTVTSSIGFVVGLLLSLGLASSCSYNWYKLDRDLNAVQTRAQVAADREDMLAYTRQFEENLRAHDAVDGHAALIFKTPRNDLSLQHESVLKIINRLESIKNVERNTTTYQVALDDIRGTLREVPMLAGNLAWVRYAWWTLLVVFLGWPLLCGVGYVVGRSDR